MIFSVKNPVATSGTSAEVAWWLRTDSVKELWEINEVIQIQIWGLWVVCEFDTSTSWMWDFSSLYWLSSPPGAPLSCRLARKKSLASCSPQDEPGRAIPWGQDYDVSMVLGDKWLFWSNLLGKNVPNHHSMYYVCSGSEARTVYFFRRIVNRDPIV